VGAPIPKLWNLPARAQLIFGGLGLFNKEDSTRKGGTVGD
jgi:hypothetical protein